MRVLIVADTHGCIDARICELARQCDHVVHAGDVGAAVVLDRLGAEGAVISAVRGNNDTPEKWSAASQARLAQLPTLARVDLPGGSMAIVHGDRYAARSRHDALRRDYADARVIVYGHSHRLLIDDSREPWVINPGAAGRARTNGGPSCLLLQVDTDRWQVQAQRFGDGFREVL